MSELRRLLEWSIDALPEDRRVVSVLREVFPFHLTRCDRIVAAVFETIRRLVKD